MKNSKSTIPEIAERTLGGGQTDLLLQMEEDYSLIANSPPKPNEIGELRSWTRIISPSVQKKPNRAYLETKHSPKILQPAIISTQVNPSPVTRKKLANTSQGSGWRHSFQIGHNSEPKNPPVSNSTIKNRSTASFLISTPHHSERKKIGSGENTPERRKQVDPDPQRTIIRLELPRSLAGSFGRPKTPSVVTLLQNEHSAGAFGDTGHVSEQNTILNQNQKHALALSMRDGHTRTPTLGKIGLLDGAAILKRTILESPRPMIRLEAAKSLRSFHPPTLMSMEDRANIAINRSSSATASGFYRPKPTKQTAEPATDRENTRKAPLVPLGLQAAAVLNKNRFFVGKIRRAIATDSRPPFIAEKDWESLKITRGFLTPKIAIPSRL